MGESYGHMNTAEAAVTYEKDHKGRRKRIISPEAIRAVMTDFFKDRQEKKNGKKNEDDRYGLGVIFSSAVAAFATMFTLKSAERINQEKEWGDRLTESLRDFLAISPSPEDEPDVQPS